jgi:hypothetical protein
MKFRSVTAGIATLFLLLVSSLAAFAQDSPEIKNERVFKGKALYGFMNGGSDLFLEYGFEELTAAELSYKGNSYTVEVYKMPSPEDAYGIYSQHTFKCNPADSRFCYDCTSPMQFQTAMGNLYITVVYTSSSAGAASDATELAEFFFKKYGTGDKLSIPDIISSYFNEGEKVTSVLKYARGPISLSNFNSSVMAAVDGLEGYSAWLLKGSKDLVYLDLGNQENLNASLRKISEEGGAFPYIAKQESGNILVLTTR